MTYFKFKDNICFKTNNEFQIFCHFDVGTTMTYKIHYKGKHDLSLESRCGKSSMRL
jgi:hypothetical protein